MYENEQDSTFSALLAQYQIILSDGAKWYTAPSLDAGYQQRAQVISQDREQARRRYARASSTDGRDAVLRSTAQSVVASYSTMGIPGRSAPSWVYSLAGVPRSIGVAPAPPVPVNPSSSSSSGNTYNVSPTVAPTFAPSASLGLGGGLLLTLLLWVAGRVLDEENKSQVASDDDRE